MKTVNINDPDVVNIAAEVLRSGGVVMHPTETCYGLAVDIFNEKALEKLYEIKGRDDKKPVSILVSDLKMALMYGDFSGKALDLAEKYWPGPLSIVVVRSEKLPEFVNPGENFVSIRFSDFEFCTKLVSALGRPVTTTSANKTGESALYKADVYGFEGVDLVIDGGELPKNKPSTIVKVTGEKVEVLRQGDLVLK